VAKTFSVQAEEDQRTGNIRLSPVDYVSEEAMRSLKRGKKYKVEVREDRSRGDLNVYWAGIGLLVRNYSGPGGAVCRINGRRYDPRALWPTSRSYHEMLMKATGHMKKKYFIDRDKPGGIGWTEEVDSIALDNMEDEAFKNYCEMAAAITVELFDFDPFEEWKKQHPLPNAKGKS
jgi:hypothetical protein